MQTPTASLLASRPKQNTEFSMDMHDAYCVYY